MIEKKNLTETDIRTKFITPAIAGENGQKKWDMMTQVREEAFFTKGRVMVRGKTVKRGKAKKADNLLGYIYLTHQTPAFRDVNQGMGQPNLNTPVIAGCPPLAEQRRIVAKVDQLMALVDKLEAQLAASRATAEKLMDAAVAELTRQ